jgi:hypothetical protein
MNNTTQPITQRLLKGSAGWVYVTIEIAIWDYIVEEDEQLTRAFRRGLKSPSGKILICTCWSILTAHLFGLIPKNFDPIYIAAEAAQRRRRREQARSQPTRES